MDSLSRSGFWWLPDNPDQQVSGELTFSEHDGVRVRLIGSLSSTKDLLSQGRMPVVYGLTTQGERVTLSDALSSEAKLTFAGAAAQTLSAQIVYLGAHLGDPATTRFRRLEARCSFLLEWADRFGLSMSLPVTPDSAKPDLELAYKRPEEVKILTSRAIVGLTYSLHQSGDLRSEVRLQHTTWLCLDHPTGLPFVHWEQQLLRPISTLLTLAAGRPSYIHEMRFFLDPQGGNADDKRPIGLFFSTGDVSGAPPSSRPAWMDMLFTLRDLEPNASDALERWFRASEELDSVYGLFFGVYYNPNMFVEQRFLSMLSGLESYHRRRIANTVLPEDEHRAKVAAILAAAPSDSKKWLQFRLQYSNEPDLRRRLRDLLERAKAVAGPLLADEGRFVDKIADTRNYYTHYDASLRDRAARDAGSLYWLSEILGIIVTDCMLSELGLPPENRAQRIRDRRNYGMVAREARRL